MAHLDKLALIADFAETHTFPYKTSESVAIYVDVLLPIGSTAEDEPKPVLVFWHGGGLTAGARQDNQPVWLYRDAIAAGYAILAPDYTLLTPTTARDILNDVMDFARWLHNDMQKILQHNKLPRIDIDRLCVSGSSAGGYPSYLYSLYAKQAPCSMALLYPMTGHLLSDSWLKPSPPPEIPGMHLPGPGDEAFEDIVHRSAGTVTANDPGFPTPRIGYFFWLKSLATFLDVFTGHTGLSSTLGQLSDLTARRAAIPSEFVDLFPELANIPASFPPTIFIHGTGDDLITTAESRVMHEKISAAGVESVLHEVQGANHGFDIFIHESSAMPELGKVMPFILERTSHREL